ncbi:MAG: RlmE family RNA methyltransferase [Desulfosudaceae bacterium]
MSKKKRAPGRREDHYARQARTDRYPARSVYKLMEIQKKHGLIKRNDTVVDLGCAPGSWLLYAAELVGPGGAVSGLDKKPVSARMPANVTLHIGDINDFDTGLLQNKTGGVKVVLSDMAPDTTGNKSVDAARSHELAARALTFALSALAPGGNFACKIFQGEDFKPFVNQVKNGFERHVIFKPESCRKESRETYVIGLKKKESTDVGT